jgi:6-phosphogluconolactonase
VGVTPDVRVSADKETLFHTGADLFSEIVQSAVSERGRCTIALSGGSTPRGLFTLLAQEPYRSAISWAQCEIFWGDERCVPPDDPESNYGMARETLLDQVAIPAAHIHRMHGEDPPDQAAAAYEQELRRVFIGDGPQPPAHRGQEPRASLVPTESERDASDWPRFDLILLGMGDEGHTASLFPGSAALAETRRWVVAHYVEKVHMDRLTLTLPVLNHARNVVFLVSGASKTAALHAALTGDGGPDSVPSGLVRPIDGRLIWLVDAVAMGKSPGR